MPAMKEIKIKYHYSPEIPLSAKEGSDWIDLYTAEDAEIKGGEYKEISLGVSIKLPRGYEAIIAPRSSTFKKYGIICPNSIGIIDNSYCGNDDVWKFPAVSLLKTVFIPKGTRLCQFRIIRNMPEFVFKLVDKMRDKNRGGIGSTGD